ncbi:MAG: SSS family solute:Na+ symporter [Woeseiaceae bacterium]
MSDQGLILTAVGIYLLGMIALGIYAARRAKSSTDFMIAGRNLGLPLATGTMLATWMGAGTIMGAAGAAYGGGFLAVIADPFGAALCLFLIGFIMARLMRRLKLITVTEFLEQKYDRRAGLLAACGLLIAYVGWTAAQFVAFGFILNTFTGIDTEFGIYLGAAIVLTYTAFGGMWAVALTDFVQMIIIVAGILILFPLALNDIGGWSAFTAALPEHSFSMIPVEHTTDSWLNYLADWAVLGIGSLAAQDTLQRSFASKNESVAQNSAYLAAIGYLTIGVIPVLLGMIGFVAMPGLADPETVVPQLALMHLPPFLMAVFISALLAAIMSSSDSAILASSSIITATVAPVFKSSMNERQRLNMARWSVPAIGVLALLVALELQVVYDLVLGALGVILAVLVVPTLLAMWWPKANRAGAVASMLTGFVVWIGLPFVAPGMPSDLLASIAGLGVMLAVSSLTQESDPPKPVRNIDGEIEPLTDRLGIIGLRR